MALDINNADFRMFTDFAAAAEILDEEIPEIRGATT